MSAIQTIKNVAVTQDSINRVVEDLNLQANESQEQISVSFKSGAYGSVNFKSRKDGNFDINYDSMYNDEVKKLVDCVIHEEAIRQVELATGGVVQSNHSYNSYLSNEIQELEAVVQY